VAEQAATGLNSEWAVVETARRHPATVAVFARLRMDACCGGAESIRNSAQHNGLKVEDVMEQLETAIREEHHDEARATGA
jgi:iron-sulfur cluster repair protein YtfE (RIC family)